MYEGITASYEGGHSFYAYALNDPDRVFMYTMIGYVRSAPELELEFTRTEWEDLIGEIKEKQSADPLYKFLKLNGHPFVPTNLPDDTQITLARGGRELEDTLASVEKFVLGVCNGTFEFKKILRETRLVG